MFPSWWVFGLTFLAISQVIIMLVTVYFHRACSHRSVVLSYGANRVARFLSWYLIAMVPQEFAAVHRKHHAKCDTAEDPHSPLNEGAMGVLFKGLALYRKEANNKQTIEQYGKGLPIDPWEAFYLKNRNLGILLFAATLALFLGWKGLLLWGLMMIWIPFWAAGVINGLAHHIGYRNYHTEDLSTNLYPWGVWVGGEELHNNHHAYPASAKFSQKWWEVDLGWGVIKTMQVLGLATVREEKESAGVIGFLGNKHIWLNSFHQALEPYLNGVVKETGFSKWRQLSATAFSFKNLDASAKSKLEQAKEHPVVLRALELEQELQRFWKERGHFSVQALEAWKEKAKSFNWPRLEQFAETLPTTPNPAHA